MTTHAKVALNEAPRGGFDVVEFLPADKCEHLMTMCVDCRNQWETDWRVEVVAD